jgi:DNA-binding NarL/FixJ family response regulator
VRVRRGDNPSPVSPERGTRVAVLRTLVVTLSPFLCELVTSVLAPEISVDVVGVLPTRERLVEGMREIAPDIVLLGLGEGEAETADPLLRRTSSVARILALARNGKSAWLYESPHRRVTLSDLSVASLKEALITSLRARSN